MTSAPVAGAIDLGRESADVLSWVIDTVVSANAAEVDRSGAYPRAAVDALGRIGFLGLVSATEVGGLGADLGTAAHVIERVAEACGSTAMAMLTHYTAATVIEAHGPEDVRRAIAAGEHVSTLAFPEAASPGHFLTSTGTATTVDGDRGQVSLEAQKSWVTSATEADSYVWSSRSLEAAGPMTLWLVPSGAQGLCCAGVFHGLGLRGDASSPVTAKGARVPAAAMLGADGAGLEVALHTVLPTFLVLNAAFSLGLAEALTSEALAYLSGTRLEHLDEPLAEQPLAPAAYARLRTRTDQARAFLRDTLVAVKSGRHDARLRVLQVRAVAAEAASQVADEAMRLCGAALRGELGVERRFRDALTARAMAPDTDALLDAVGRVSCGLQLPDGGGV